MRLELKSSILLTPRHQLIDRKIDRTKTRKRTANQQRPRNRSQPQPCHIDRQGKYNAEQDDAADDAVMNLGLRFSFLHQYIPL